MYIGENFSFNMVVMTFYRQLAEGAEARIFFVKMSLNEIK